MRKYFFIGIVVILSIYSCIQYIENKNYEKYIKELTEQKYTNITYAIKSNDRTLKEITEDKLITVKQVSYLMDNYSLVVEYGQELNRLLQIINNKSSSSELAKAAGLIKAYLEEDYYINDVEGCNNSVILDENNNDIKIIRDYNSQWVGVIDKYEDYLMYKELRKIEKDYWVAFITDLDNVSSDILRSENFQLIRKGRE